MSLSLSAGPFSLLLRAAGSDPGLFRAAPLRRRAGKPGLWRDALHREREGGLLCEASLTLSDNSQNCLDQTVAGYPAEFILSTITKFTHYAENKGLQAARFLKELDPMIYSNSFSTRYCLPAGGGG